MTRPGFGNFSIEIDLAPLEVIAREMVQQPDPEILRQGTMEAAEHVLNVWDSAVTGNQLPGMVRPVQDDDYAAALATGDNIRLPSPWWGIVMCTYPGAVRVEKGYNPFDIKPGLLNSPNAKRTKDGRPYQDVPFRHFTPGGTRKPHPGHFGERVHGQTMPPNIYEIAKNTEPGGRVKGDVLAWQGIRSKVPALVNAEARRRGLEGGMPHAYTWKTGLHAGMIRGSRAKHGQYMTFRRVSERSDPASWWHPGMQGNPVMRAVVDASQEEVAGIMGRWYCRAIGRPDLVDKVQVS